jgi:aspartyl protease family protein
MSSKIFKFSLMFSVTLLFYACGDKTPKAFDEISMVEATSTKEGFLPFRIYFPKKENPYVCYVGRDGKLNPMIEITYSHSKKDENSIIYFFTDKADGVYQIRIKDRDIIRMRFVNEKLDRNIPYVVERVEKREIIPLERIDNMHYITVEVNGMKLKFMLDTGCSDILISVAEATVLMKQGLLKEKDILGENESEIADGTIVEGDIINLRTLKIGNKTLKNVKATVFYYPHANLLLGQSVLSRFGKYTIDNKRNELILE